MRVLTSPAETGAVFLGLPQDIQTYAFDYPVEMFEKRVWAIPRNRPDRDSLATAAAWIREAKRPVIFAGGGVRYSEATDALRAFAEQTGIPVAETHAGKGSMPYDHPLSLGGAGVSGTLAANVIGARGGPRHRHRDPVHGLPDRVQDRVPGPRRPVRQHQRRGVRRLQARRGPARRRRPRDPRGARGRGGGLLDAPPSTGSASPRSTASGTPRSSASTTTAWATILTQGEVIGAVEASTDPRDVVVTSAGSLPGDLLKLWRSRDASELPGGVRLLDDGLRDRRRRGREARRAGPRGLRHGRRRLVPDDEQRDHDRRPGGPQAHRS